MSEQDDIEKSADTILGLIIGQVDRFSCQRLVTLLRTPNQWDTLQWDTLLCTDQHSDLTSELHCCPLDQYCDTLPSIQCSVLESSKVRPTMQLTWGEFLS